MYQPLQPVPDPRPSDRTWIVVIAAILLGTAGMLTGVLLALLPLPPQDVGQLSNFLVCGDGATAHSSLYIAWNPTWWQTGRSASEIDYYRPSAQLCASAATTRVVWSAIAGLTGLAAMGGALGYWFEWFQPPRTRGRQETPPGWRP